MDSPESVTDDAQLLAWADDDARRWSTRIDVPLATELKEAGFDIKDHERLAKLLADPYDAADFVVAVHRRQWEKQGMSESEFLDLVTRRENTFSIVLDRTVAGLVDFFHRFRDVLRAGVVAKAIEAADMGRLATTRKVNSPKVDQALRAELERNERHVDERLDALISGETSGGLSENSASTHRV
ncbi:MAG: hypothetical protein Aurels2KO_25300 [Aureliella sp.]